MTLKVKIAYKGEGGGVEEGGKEWENKGWWRGGVLIM